MQICVYVYTYMYVETGDIDGRRELKWEVMMVIDSFKGAWG